MAGNLLTKSNTLYYTFRVKAEIEGMLVEWDENKNQLNIRKHGISFQTAALVFVRNRTRTADASVSRTARGRTKSGLNTLISCTARMKNGSWCWDAFREYCMLSIR